MIQVPLLPEVIRRIEPNRQRSADSPGIGVAVSGQRYVLKCALGPRHPWLPASEWICHALALTVQLAVPAWAVCVLPDGSECFGSRMEGAVVGQQYLPVPAPAITVDNPEAVSRSLVLDLFVGNDDRHAGNWMVTETGGVLLLRPIDYSRALLWCWPPTLPPWPAHCHSQNYYQLAASLGVLDKAVAKATLAQLSQLPKSHWRSIVESVPDAWLPQALRTELVNWWFSPMWHARIKWIEAQL